MTPEEERKRNVAVDRILEDPKAERNIRRLALALAYERENLIVVSKTIEQLKLQLAAEKERATSFQMELAKQHTQLAAEKEKREDSDEHFKRACKELAAEMEKGQSLVDTLKAAHEDCKRANDNCVRLEQQLAAERGAQHHMEACRALLNVPDDEVLYGAIEELREQLAAAQGDLRFALEQLEQKQQEIEWQRNEIPYFRRELAAERERSRQLLADMEKGMELLRGVGNYPLPDGRTQ